VLSDSNSYGNFSTYFPNTLQILVSTSAATTMATSTSNLFEFDGGDLRISVTYKGDRLAGKVSTSAMMLASPVWKKFIFPPFAQLHEDDEEDDQEYTAVYEGGLVAARKESATDCKGSQKEIAWTQKSPVGCATVWIDHEASYPDETMTEDTDLFDEDLNTTDFQSLENGSIANIDTEKSSAQFQDAQPRTEPNSQSTGTLIGDETLSDEIHGESVAPKAKKRRIAEVPKSKELDFTEDNGEALLILLRIAHLQFHELPEKEMSLDFLLNLAILCDMYDCQKLVKPWVSQWCIFSNLVRPDAALEKLLFVAFVFSKTSIVDLRIKAAKTIAPKPSGGYEFQTKRDAGKPKPIDLNHFPATELGERRTGRSMNSETSPTNLCQYRLYSSSSAESLNKYTWHRF